MTHSSIGPSLARAINLLSVTKTISAQAESVEVETETPKKKKKKKKSKGDESVAEEPSVEEAAAPVVEEPTPVKEEAPEPMETEVTPLSTILDFKLKLFRLRRQKRKRRRRSLREMNQSPKNHPSLKNHQQILPLRR